MTLRTGSRVGAYEVLGAIGAGGMGEVYRAHDTRLGRDVAIKVLPAAFLDDSDRRSRFEREARAVAAISHPNIVSVFDTGLHDGHTFIVMELLRGETLRERLAAGALPVRKAIDVAVQLARGLATAHAAGIVHRDLKPENIILLPDGLVKILDFGLARQIAGAPESTATVTATTDPGSVLGSAGYMAPEQVRGEPADARTDIFALGAVLYEMLTGRRAFARDTPVEAMTAVLREEPPDLPASRTDLPAGLARAVHHCLEKRPEDRFQSASDLAYSLSALSEVAVPPVRTGIRGGSRRMGMAVVVAAAILAAGLLFVRGLRPDETPVTFQTLTHRLEWITRARFGPDGRTIVFSAAPAGNVPELYVLPPDRTVPQSLGRATHLLAVSSKGELAVLTQARYLHFFMFEGTLARMTLDGAPRPWLEHVREADWAPDGSTLAIVHALETEDRLEYPIGTVLYRTQGYISDPRVSPDGSRVAFLDHQLRYDNRGWVKVVDSHGNVRTLAGEFSGEESPVWSPDGRRLYLCRDRTRRGTVSADGRQRRRHTADAPCLCEPGAHGGRGHQRGWTTARHPSRRSLGASGAARLGRRGTRRILARFRLRRHVLARPARAALHRRIHDRRRELRHGASQPRDGRGGPPRRGAEPRAEPRWTMGAQRDPVDWRGGCVSNGPRSTGARVARAARALHVAARLVPECESADRLRERAGALAALLRAGSRGRNAKACDAAGDDGRARGAGWPESARADGVGRVGDHQHRPRRCFSRTGIDGC